MNFYKIARSLLFRLDAERAHHLTLSGLRMAQRLGIASFMRSNAPQEPVKVMGLRIETALKNIQKSRKGFDGILGINIGKNKITPNENALDDYVHCFRKSYGHADYIAVNISSPNTSGLRELQTPKFARELLSPLMKEKEKLKEETGKNVPVAVKIDPDMGNDQIKDLSGLFNELQIDAVIATNTTVSRMSISDHRLSNEKGGLSGAPLNERSNEVIAELHAELKDKIPIIGVGGINSKKDAEEKLSAGASLIQIYTGLIYQGPSLIKQLVRMEK